MPNVSLFKPGGVKGFASALDPKALPEGLVPLIQNARLGTRVFQARFPDVSVNAAVTTGITAIRGFQTLTVNGTQTLLLACGDGSHVTVYKSADGGATWSSITPTSGAYGDTRLTDSSSHPVRFQVIRDNPAPGQTPSDMVLITNGVDAPRIYDSSRAAGRTTSKAYAVPAIANDSNLQVIPRFANYLQVGNQSVVGTPHNSDATKMALTNSGVSATDNYLILKVKAAYTAGVESDAAFSNPMNMSAASQLVIVADSNIDSLFWQKVGISISDGTNSLVVFDPSAPTGAVTSVDRTIANGVFTPPGTFSSYAAGVVTYTGTPFVASAYLNKTAEITAGLGAGYVGTVTANTNATITLSPAPTSFDATSVLNLSNFVNLRQLAYEVPPASTINMGAVTKITFTWPSVAPAAEITANIYMIAASGQFQGGSLFQTSLYMSDARQEGPGTLITKESDQKTSFGGGTAVAGAPTFTDDDRFYYDYLFACSNPATATKNAGVDKVRVYGALTGQTSYFLVAEQFIGSYSGSWSYSNGGVAGDAFTTTSNFAQDLALIAPGAAALPISLTVSSAISANGHTFALDGQILWFSDFQRPFVFRSAVNSLNGAVDQASGGSIQFAGQTLQSAVAVGAVAGQSVSNSPASGRAAIYLLTGANIFEITGFDATSLSRAAPIAAYGTLSPLSVVRSLHGLYWLDQTGQMCFLDSQAADQLSMYSQWGTVRYFGSGVNRFGRKVIDNKTIGITQANKTWVSGAVIDDAFHLALIEPGRSVQDRMLRYSEVLGSWESEDTGAFDALTVYVGDRPKLLAATVVGGTVQVNEIAQNGAVGNVSVLFQSIEMPQDHPGGASIARAMTAYCDSASGATLATSRYFPAENVTSSGTIPLTDSNPRVFNLDGLRVGASGQSFYCTVSGSVPGGWNLYSLLLDVESQDAPSAKRA